MSLAGLGRRLSGRWRRGKGLLSHASVELLRALGGERALRYALHLREGRPGASLARWESLRGQWSGRKVVLIGTGPSVNDVDWRRLEAGTVLCALNRAQTLAAKMGHTPDMVVMSDPTAMADYGERETFGVGLVCLSTQASRTSGFCPPDAVLFDQWLFPKMDRGFFQTDMARPLYQSRSVAHAALQILVWMGCSEIICVGVDFTFAPSAPHFYPTHGKEAARSGHLSVANAESMAQAFVHARRALERDGRVAVYNAGDPHGRNPFPYKPWDMCFPIRKEPA